MQSSIAGLLHANIFTWNIMLLYNKQLYLFSPQIEKPVIKCKDIKY